jgi:hypothetical protein
MLAAMDVEGRQGFTRVGNNKTSIKECSYNTILDAAPCSRVGYSNRNYAIVIPDQCVHGPPPRAVANTNNCSNVIGGNLTISGQVKHFPRPEGWDGKK